MKSRRRSFVNNIPERGYGDLDFPGCETNRGLNLLQSSSSIGGRSSSCIIARHSVHDAVGVTGERGQEMVLKVFNDKSSLGKAAAQKAAAAIRGAVRDSG